MHVTKRDDASIDRPWHIDSFDNKGLSENNLSAFATRFGLDLDGTIEEKPKHSRAMVRFFRLRRLQRWPEDWLRNVQVIFTQTLSARQEKKLPITNPLNPTMDRAHKLCTRLKTPYRDGTTHLVMTPLEFLQRLAALVPRPRLHLIRFHGVLTPNAALRSQIVPGDQDQAPAIADGDGEAPAASTRAHRSWAQLLKRSPSTSPPVRRAAAP